MSTQTVAVLAVQGAFAEHERKLAQLGVPVVEIRQAADLSKSFDRLVLPGGESTAQGKILRDLNMLSPLRSFIEDGMPVLGTCAGLILLAQRIDDVNGDGSSVDEQHNSTWLATMPVTVRRNAYGRQLGSFHVYAPFAGLGADEAAAGAEAAGAGAAGAAVSAGAEVAADAVPAEAAVTADSTVVSANESLVPMTFIRAPYVTQADESVQVLARVNGMTVAVRYKNQLGLSFHPELDNDLRIHRYFLNM